MLPPCPHCGAQTGVYMKVRAFGWCEEYYEVGGRAIEMSDEGLQFTFNQTLRCDDCMMIRRDLGFDQQNGLVVSVERIAEEA